MFGEVRAGGDEILASLVSGVSQSEAGTVVTWPDALLSLVLPRVSRCQPCQAGLDMNM